MDQRLDRVFFSPEQAWAGSGMWSLLVANVMFDFTYSFDCCFLSCSLSLSLRSDPVAHPLDLEELPLLGNSHHVDPIRLVLDEVVRPLRLCLFSIRAALYK